MFYVIHLAETDGDIQLKLCRDETEVRKYIKSNNLLCDEYFVIKGDLVAI